MLEGQKIVNEHGGDSRPILALLQQYGAATVSKVPAAQLGQFAQQMRQSYSPENYQAFVNQHGAYQPNVL